MSTPHTPGPWTHRMTGKETGFMVGPLVDLEYGIIHPVVCRLELDMPAVYCHSGPHNGTRQRKPREEQERVFANAALLSSAPELLEALRILLACPDLGLDELEPETIAAIETAECAIAKATREQL